MQRKHTSAFKCGEQMRDTLPRQMTDDTATDRASGGPLLMPQRSTVPSSATACVCG